MERLPYTRAVIEEAMRLFPPVPFSAGRRCGTTGSAGSRCRGARCVMVAPWVLHRHQLLWDDPEAFVPERFLPENRDSIARFTYLPSGRGRGSASGKSFSVQEAVILLAHIVRAVRFHLPAITRRSRRSTG